MARFDDGVKKFVRARAVVEVVFPIDWRDNPDISCKQCQFFINATRKCGLTQGVVNFPERYVGHDCPLEEVIEEDNNDV